MVLQISGEGKKFVFWYCRTNIGGKKWEYMVGNSGGKCVSQGNRGLSPLQTPTDILTKSNFLTKSFPHDSMTVWKNIDF